MHAIATTDTAATMIALKPLLKLKLVDARTAMVTTTPMEVIEHPRPTSSRAQWSRSPSVNPSSDDLSGAAQGEKPFFHLPDPLGMDELLLYLITGPAKSTAGADTTRLQLLQTRSNTTAPDYEMTSTPIPGSNPPCPGRSRLRVYLPAGESGDGAAPRRGRQRASMPGPGFGDLLVTPTDLPWIVTRRGLPGPVEAPLSLGGFVCGCQEDEAFRDMDGVIAEAFVEAHN